MVPGLRLRPLIVAPAALALLLTACEGVQREANYPDADRDDRYRYGSLSGNDGFRLLGPAEEDADTGGGTGLGVNGYLWRASLDTVSFMPIASADPFGGVILTDWYAPPNSPQERFKLNVFILGRQLRSDGLRVAVFRQVLAPQGGWENASVSSDVSVTLEDTILSRARDLRISQLASQ